MAVARGKTMHVKVASKEYAFIMSLPCSPSDLIFFCALDHSWFISKFIVFPASSMENRSNAGSNLFWNLLFQVKPEHKYPGTLYWSLFCEGRWAHMGWDSSSVKQYSTEAHSRLLSAFLTILISVSGEDCVSFKRENPWVPMRENEWPLRDILLGSCMKQGVGHEPDTYLVLYVLSQERLENRGLLWSHDLVCQLTRSGLLAFPCNCCVRASHAEAARVIAEEETTTKSSFKESSSEVLF